MNGLENLSFAAEYDSDVYRPNICLLPTLGRNLINLKTVSIFRYHLNEKSILAFLETAPQLEVLTFKKCSFSISKKIVKSNSILREEQTKKKNSNAPSLIIGVEQDVSEFEDLDNFVIIKYI